MPDNTTIGFVVGVGVGLVALYVIMQAMDDNGGGSTGQSQPQFVSHNVVRDEEGRIKQVESFRGMNTGAVVQETQQPLAEPAEVTR